MVGDLIGSVGETCYTQTMTQSLHSDPGLRDAFSSALFTEILSRLPAEFSLVVHIRPDGSKYYRAECVGNSWSEPTLEELAAAVLNTLVSPPARENTQPVARHVIEDTSSPLDIIDSIEAARISGMTRHQIRAAVVKGKLRQVEGHPPVSLVRGEVLEWAKRERAIG